MSWHVLAVGSDGGPWVGSLIPVVRKLVTYLVGMDLQVVGDGVPHSGSHVPLLEAAVLACDTVSG